MTTQEIHPASTLARVRRELAAARNVVKPSAEEREIISTYQELNAEHAKLSAHAQLGPMAAVRHADMLKSIEHRMGILWPAYQHACADRSRNRATIEALEAEERSYLQTVQITAAELAQIDAEEQAALAAFEQRRAALREQIANLAGDPDRPERVHQLAEQATAERAKELRNIVLQLLRQAQQNGSRPTEEEDAALRGVLNRLNQLPVSVGAIDELYRVVRPLCRRYEAA